MSNLEFSYVYIENGVEFLDLRKRLEDIVSCHDMDLISPEYTIDERYENTICYYMDKYKELFKSSLSDYLKNICNDIEEQIRLSGHLDNFKQQVLFDNEISDGCMIIFASSRS